MQITIENLQKARRLDAKQFLEVFNESTATLKAELANLNTIVSRFSDFSKMPAPKFVRVNVNEVLRNAVRLFEPQFNAVGKPTITQEPFLTEPLPEIDADPDLLHRAFQNLVLNAMDAMPAGGMLTLRTAEHDGNVRIEVADTGKGLRLRTSAPKGPTCPAKRISSWSTMIPTRWLRFPALFASPGTKPLFATMPTAPSSFFAVNILTSFFPTWSCPARAAWNCSTI